ncbi:High potential iron-sulfur protein [Luminiphilus syltensis NOR5-1B]|uniref:High-potential iron-sulfur protein n=1 Tax=Luminiphilus syltensis NOR5-1B TaxID=565045 RepID=B8KVF3_9GAMM|nr:high-potential iron-sulfur protein [Luminiphilus syltensis]EED34682.1 High potential iron-sulfur protein [Luminiphilus syltensis NOR5-1B]
MQSDKTNFEQRRKLLALLGTGAVALPVLGLTGCGGDDSSPTAASLQDSASDAAAAMEDTAESAMEEAATAADTAGEAMTETMEAAEDVVEETAEGAQTIASDASSAMAKVDENGAQAQGLGYRHDATTIDTSAQPRYAAGQQCSNCALWQGGDAEWGGCPLFAGQQVKATGWCTAYNKAG